jgi:hypothetical protein
VVAAIARKGGTQLVVAPITHAAPMGPADAIELPPNVKKQIGLDSDRSWIVLTELNSFIWPGPDIRIAPGQQSPHYDAIPDWLFFDVRDGVVRHRSAGRLRVTKRTN